MAPSPLNNHKVSWLKSERKGLGKIQKSLWCSGGAVVLVSLTDKDRFPVQVPEWKNGLGRIEK